jgi:WD40 repeat protein/mono/diheme cytochrome c family protein
MTPVASFFSLGLSLMAWHQPMKPENAATDKPVSYHKQIRPLVQVHCQGCHQPAKAQGAYIMTDHAALMKAGDRGLAGVVPGKPAESHMLEVMRPKDGKRADMPRGAEPLPEKDIALVEKWIREGAKDDTPASARDTVNADNPPVYGLPPVITTLDVSPDGKLLAVNGHHEVLLFEVGTWKLVGRLVGLSQQVQSLAFSPDGKWLGVSGGNPGRFGEIQVWDVQKRKLKVASSFTGDTLFGLSWSPDSRLIAFGGADNIVRAVDASNGKQVLQQGAHNDWVLGTCFSRDGKYLVSASRDRTLKLTEVATQRFIDNVTSITPGALKGGLQVGLVRPGKEKKMVKASSIAVASTEEKVYEEVLIGGADGMPRLYKMHRETKRVIGDDANKVREYPALAGRIYAMAFAPDGKIFAAGSSLDGAGVLRVVNAEDGKQVSQAEGQVGAIYALAFAPDGKTLFAGGFDGQVRVIDPATGKVLNQFTVLPGGPAAVSAKAGPG